MSTDFIATSEHTKDNLMRLNLKEIAARSTADDSASPLWEALGDLSKFEPSSSYVLVASYVAPEKIGSIYVSDKRMDEDRFQGKTGLVVRCGALAFADDARVKWGGFAPQVGDWVIYNPSNGFECFIRDRRKVNEGTSCRFIHDSLIISKVPAPDLIY